MNRHIVWSHSVKESSLIHVHVSNLSLQLRRGHVYQLKLLDEIIEEVWIQNYFLPWFSGVVKFDGHEKKNAIIFQIMLISYIRNREIMTYAIDLKQGGLVEGFCGRCWSLHACWDAWENFKETEAKCYN